MALELQPFMTMLDNYRRQQQRREQEESRQRPSPPEWAQKLNPDDFKGKTRAMLLEAQAAGANAGSSGDHPAMIGNAAGDRGMATASPLGDVGQNPSSTGLVDSVRGLIGSAGREPVEQTRPRNGLSSEQLADLVPFDTRQPLSPIAPDTRQRLAPAPAQRRLSPVSEPRERVVGRHNQSAAETMDREAAEVKARRDQVGREDSVHPHAGADPREQPRHFNLRKALGPHVGDGGDFVSMARRYRQTGELPGNMAGGQGQATARGSGGSDTLAGRSGSPQPTAARGGGGGLFGGDGPGLGYVLGGIGAMLSSAGGQEGAVDRFVERYGERQREQRLTNQTRQAAIDLGIDPGFARNAPISALMPLLGEAYKRKHAGPQYEFKGDRWWQVGPDGVQPVTDATTDQTIPGTQIGFDTDIGRKYSAFRGQGFSHEQALGVASGRYDLKVTDNGLPVMIDTLNNREVPIQRVGPAEIGERQQLGPTPGRQDQGQPQQPGQTDALGLEPQRDKTLYQMADSGTGLWNIIGDFFGRVGPQFVPGDKQFFNDQREAVTTIRTANRGLVRALQQSPRYAEGERKSIEQEIALNPSIGMSPEAWRQSAVAVDSLLRSWWQEDMQDAQSDTLAADDRQRALASARAIERYLQILGVPQGDGQGGGGDQGQREGQGGGQGAADIVPGTIAVHPQTGQRIRLNENGEWEEVQ